MLIALLALLGIDLIVIVVFLAAVLGRRRWVSRRDGAFGGATHLAAGDLDGLGTRQRRGYGHWVRDVLIWTPAPLFLRNAIVPIDRVEDSRPAAEGEVRRLGDDPLVVTLSAGRNRIEIAVRAEDRTLVLAPFAAPAAGTSASTPRPVDPAGTSHDG